ncbi:hypothetical protein LOZ12_001600 [Ophidiomyces ophidiicola]|uniref:uncharacterized protein n=1 Tax=Ophidiomyces ophidiicola TaxID=1387563 RepID=UPI0020C5025F|nr:uncharacterized protein LOZ57_002887 [Ophidiomyces ophidiicola]KAI1931347.1 hypothetical protein LOZ62_006808 [Ophidiomyces ophidiicola]KAI1948531.1 hypothetical protein LOZ57_002887 [Ophidiomyces ophidiicola]KAI1979637.1 hypothetical protein LOZ55_001782 [Ophidiomyces ophidiicola]KAI1999535.1 hypothetical protein LOZ51_002026 [Ophidiomyces ophidiicola]KAI2009537.1 hypothetical protein LOZ50_001595 [Ophidiomyces ophidiicola]
MPPSPPSNTLLITDLRRPALFQPAHLAAVRTRLAAVAPLNSFAALPALRRIVCSFATAAAAVRARQLLETDDGLDLDLRAARIYFGAPTPVAHDDPAAAAARRLLDAPLADKLFFISPPPSPPHGWVVRNEHPPNKDVHAADLAAALACLDARAPACPAANPPQTPRSDDDQDNDNNNNSDDDVSPTGSNTTTLIYHPGAHGCCPTLPAVMVEDTTLVADEMLGVGPVELPHRRILAHTPRPPVELMP